MKRHKLIIMCVLFVMCCLLGACNKKAEVIESSNDEILTYEDVVFIDEASAGVEEFYSLCACGEYNIVIGDTNKVKVLDSDMDVVASVELTDDRVATSVGSDNGEVSVAWYRYGLGFVKEYGISRYTLGNNGLDYIEDIAIDDELDCEIGWLSRLENESYAVMTMDDTIRVLGANGKFTASHRVNENDISFPVTVGNKIYVLYYVEDSNKVYLGEYEGKKSNKTELDIAIDPYMYGISLCKAIDDSAIISIGVNGNIYNYSEDGLVLAFEDYRIDRVADSVKNPDGSVRVLGEIKMFGDSTTIASVNLSSRQKGTKDTLTIATLAQDYVLDESVELFELLNPEIDVEVISYLSVTDTMGKSIDENRRIYMDAMKSLSLDFTTKSIDLLYLPYTYQKDLISQDMLADVSCNVDDYDVWNNVTQVISDETNGKLVVPNFQIKGTTINSEYADFFDGSIESLDRLIECCEDNDIPLIHNFTPEMVAGIVCADMLDGTLDEAGITRVLEYYKNNCNYYFNDVEVMIHDVELSSVQDYKINRDYYKGDMSLKGILLGNDKPYILVENAYSIVDRYGLNSDAINCYLDFLYSDMMGYVSVYNGSIPINKTYSHIKEIESQDAVSGVVSFNIDTTGFDSTYEYTGSSHRIEDLIDEYNELISSLDTIYYDDWYIEDIIFDEVLALTGDNGKSVDDVVSNLTGRISIYMGEKK